MRLDPEIFDVSIDLDMAPSAMLAEMVKQITNDEPGLTEAGQAVANAVLDGTTDLFAEDLDEFLSTLVALLIEQIPEEES